MFCQPLPGMRMRGCTDIMGKWYTLRCADSRYQGRNALRLDFRVSRGTRVYRNRGKTVHPGREGYTLPYRSSQYRIERLSRCSCGTASGGKCPKYATKRFFPGFGTASVGLTGHIDTAAALPYGESVPILGDCGTLSGSADWRTCLCSVLTVPRDCGRGKSAPNTRQSGSLSRFRNCQCRLDRPSRCGCGTVCGGKCPEYAANFI